MRSQLGLGLALAFAAAQAGAADFMGVELGQPFAMPECVAGKYTGYEFEWERPVRPCWKHAYGDPGEPLPAESKFQIAFVAAKDKSPPGIKSANLVVIDGKVEGVLAFTTGLESQDELLEGLTSKFGKPATLNRSDWQNRMGATFEGIDAEWSADGATVSFLGIGSRVDGGIITAYTPVGAARESADRAEQKKKAATF